MMMATLDTDPIILNCMMANHRTVKGQKHLIAISGLTLRELMTAACLGDYAWDDILCRIEKAILKKAVQKEQEGVT